MRRILNRRFGHLVAELAVSEFKLRDQSTLLGFLWTLLHPLLIFLVIYTLFVKWTGKHVESYPLYLMVGLVQWNYFSRATTNGLGSVIQRPNLVTNFIFPREALVFSTVLANLFIHIFELVVMLLFSLLLGAVISWTWLFLPLIVAIETLFVLAAALVLALLAVNYKDLARVWEVVTFAGFFVTPIFYPLSIISEEKQLLMKINPVLHIIEATRTFLIDDRMPDLTVLSFLLLAGLLSFWICYRLFKGTDHRFAERFP